MRAARDNGIFEGCNKKVSIKKGQNMIGLGTITLLARLVSPIMTEAAIANLSLVGSILIFCVGLNLVWGKTVRVANMLPGIVFAVIAAYLPWTL